jgi:2-C-methyl-D-erythritol 2,4-cyclodiphosphate synthase
MAGRHWPHGGGGRLILVHDAAALRRCLTLHRLLNELEDDPVGGLLAIPLGDTLKRAEPGAGLRVASTEDRTGLWCAQTPQMFRYAILHHALRKAVGKTITDEAQAIEALGVKPRLVLGSAANIKLTYPEDLALAEAILARVIHDERRHATRRQWFRRHARRRATSGTRGHGAIRPRSPGHSNADVLIHAICDAILGARCAGDLGRHFPDTDAAYRDADSRVLLKSVWQRAVAAGYALGNVDVTVIAEAPRLAPYVAQMVTNIAADLGAATAQVNVKATTSEGLGFIGRGEGIAALATVLLVRRDP